MSRSSYCHRCGLKLRDLEHVSPADCIQGLQDRLRKRGRCSSCDRVVKTCGACAIKGKAMKRALEAGGPLVGGLDKLLGGIFGDEDVLREDVRDDD